jgi:hypothetical protein
VLIQRRGAGEWWEGLWDFPREPHAGRGRGARLGVVSYTVTHHKVTCTVVARAAAADSGIAARRWVTLRQLATLPP